MPLPVELTQYPHWIVWRAEDRKGKVTKVPYQPRNLLNASVTEPQHWASYEEAMKLYQSGHGNFSGVGFVLSRHSPFSIIDLDDPTGDPVAIERAVKVLEAFDTYTELSPSGKGFHIIVRGKIAAGRRRGKIELYSEDRFFTMTGHTFKDRPINSAEFFLTKLWEELGGNTSTVSPLAPDTAQTIDDEEVFNRATKGHEMFQELWFGRWQKYYTSQSEADLTLVNLLSFYSGNKEQIARMFYYSELGKRAKAHRKGRNGKLGYLEEMIEKSFDKRVPDTTIDALMGNLRLQIEELRKARKAEAAPMLGAGWELPPGLLGEIAEFIYTQAPRPVKEIALAGAIGLMAGICGQAYNVSSTGLNQYILLLAGTGRGKEGAQSGISKIMRRVSDQLPAASQFVGPASIASGSALVKYISENPCFVSVLGEFGITLYEMCKPGAQASLAQLRKVILDLFNKSGKTDVLNGSIYSDKANGTSMLRSPALTILGETVPENFFATLDATMVTQGLLPRFTCIEYLGKRPPFNELHGTIEPSPEMIEKVIRLCQNALTLQHRHEAILVDQDEDATAFIAEFDKECDEKINAADTDVTAQLWNRGHVKLLKLAALIAVGVHPYKPIITLPIAVWAKNMVERDIVNIVTRFDTGRVGNETSEQNQMRELTTVIKDYCSRPFDITMQKYLVSDKMHSDKVLQWSYICKRMFQKAAFTGDRMGAKFALTRCMIQMVDIGAVMELTPQQIGQRYNKTGKAYAVVDLSKVE